MTRHLYRSADERVLGGVAGGIAEYFDLDPALVRVAWAVLIFATAGTFFLLYVVMWIVVPEAPPGYVPPADSPRPVASGAAATPESPGGPEGAPSAGAPAPSAGPSIAEEWWARRGERRHYRSGGGGLVLGAILILVGAWFLARDWIPWLRSAEVWPLIIIAVGVILLVTSLRPRT
jgi:phage shock protein PspC (stress-responsive transcriptional regulator)